MDVGAKTGLDCTNLITLLLTQFLPEVPQPNEIHLWCIDRSQLILPISLLFSILSPSEQTKINQLKFQRDRDQRSLGRSLLRLILGHYLAMPPGELQFQTTPLGKLSIAEPSLPLQFNVSYAGDRILYGISQQPIGVDLTHSSPVPVIDIVSRYFSAKITRFFQNLPAPERLIYFMRLWAITEAYTKGTGEGLTAPLNQLDILPNLLAPDHQATSVHHQPWWTVHFCLELSYQSAIATPIAKPVLRFIT